MLNRLRFVIEEAEPGDYKLKVKIQKDDVYVKQFENVGEIGN